ncbi:kinase-like domain-containing protein [Dendryphion nanum]|uniref:Kinase-like domain-containing protein n=1 Tax=Dendryphion nanum TaxID=256645 RepID=A0A9P9IKG6_9PLEO|nr:kinase-like domain-containing protein [Dendryphion nanum]
MSAPIDLTTEEGLRTYLEAHGTPTTDVTLLTGGTANYVYRVTLEDGKSVIYKHAAPYLHSNRDFAFDPTRMNYEDRALQTLPPLLRQQLPRSTVHAAEWYSYDHPKKLLSIEDGGDRNLKAAYEDPRIDIATIGNELGNWIAALHQSTRDTSLSLSDTQIGLGNNPIGVHIYRHSYNNLHLALEKFGYDTSLANRINEQFGSKLATDNDSVCHGDFWPGNVLVKFNDAISNQVDLTIVDWEMVRRGCNATDVGQFAAEAFLMDRFRGGRGLLVAFLNAYAVAREDGWDLIGKNWTKRMVVHWATHVAFWPTRVSHTDNDGTRKLVEIGVQILKAAVTDDWDTIRRSDLLKDVNSLWDVILERP